MATKTRPPDAALIRTHAVTIRSISPVPAESRTMGRAARPESDTITSG